MFFLGYLTGSPKNVFLGIIIMVAFYIFYLLFISMFCLPLSVKAKVFLGGKEKPVYAMINVNGLFDVFPFKLKEKADAKKSNKHKKGLKLTVKPPKGTEIFRLIQIPELKIICNNVSKFSLTGYNIGLAVLAQFVQMMRAYGSLSDFDFVSTESVDNLPSIQLKAQFKLNLFIIFSSFFKIIKITKRNKQNES